MNKKRPGDRACPHFDATKRDKPIEEATVDAYDESEQRRGFFTVLADNLALPFKTEDLGVEVSVARIDLTEDEEIVAICTPGRARPAIAILDLPLPEAAPKGAEWIAAYRRGARAR